MPVTAPHLHQTHITAALWAKSGITAAALWAESGLTADALWAETRHFETRTQADQISRLGECGARTEVRTVITMTALLRAAVARDAQSGRCRQHQLRETTSLPVT